MKAGDYIRLVKLTHQQIADGTGIDKQYIQQIASKDNIHG
jgi:hypothetical protein